jgi:hypothetical protein
MFWKNNNIWAGLALGIILPILGFGILQLIFDQLEAMEILTDDTGFSPSFRGRTLAIVALCINLLPLNRFQKLRMTDSIRGLVLATGVYIILWLVFYGQYIL